jgi:hypothetical protein
MGLNIQSIAKVTNTAVESTEEWSIGRKKTLEVMKSDWVKLIKGEIKKVANDKSRMIRWGNDAWKIRLVKSTVALQLGDKEVLSVGDKSNSKEVIKKVLENISDQIKEGNLNKEIQQHMDTCREKRNKYK